MPENEHLGPHRWRGTIHGKPHQVNLHPQITFVFSFKGARCKYMDWWAHTKRSKVNQHMTHTLTCGDTRGRSKVGPPYPGGVDQRPSGCPQLPALLHRLPTCHHAALLILDVDLRWFQWRCIQGWRDGEHTDRWRSTPSTPPINMCCIHPLKTWFIQVRN
jgi:hypothetical protein